MFNMEPLTAGCGRVLPAAAHVCIGVSPFNSYFSTERIARLAGWALERFTSCHFFVPDTVAAYTLEAQGYPPPRARHKAARQGQYVHNKITTALRSLGVPHPTELVLGMRELEANSRYLELRRSAEQFYESDPEFRTSCLEASHWVLDRKLPPGAVANEAQLHSAVRYFLAELPLFADSGGIADAGPSMFVYHQRVAFLERFYARELAWKPTTGQGFLVVSEEPAGSGELADSVDSVKSVKSVKSVRSADSVDSVARSVRTTATVSE